MVTKGLNQGMTNNEEISFLVCYECKKKAALVQLRYTF